MIKTRFEAPLSLTLHPLSLGKCSILLKALGKSVETGVYPKIYFKAGKQRLANKNHTGLKGVLVEHCDISVAIIIGNTIALRKYKTEGPYFPPMFLKLV